MTKMISSKALDKRLHWIREIVKISDDFGADFSRVEKELICEISKNKTQVLLDHLRLCSAIPESYEHDSSEEKLYSKYTDALISESFKSIGLKSYVLTERADAADVEVTAENYSFVADAKVFRLSRSAKNQKDFKIQAMDGWKRGKPYAMVVCPLYQLPTKSSQIYQQAATRSVCIFSYSHLAVLVRLAEEKGTKASETLLHKIFKSIETMNGSKNAFDYWQTVNTCILQQDLDISKIWKEEKVATLEGIEISKEIAHIHLAQERQRILSLSHEEAIKQLIEMNKIDSKSKVIESITDNNLMSL